MAKIEILADIIDRRAKLTPLAAKLTPLAADSPILQKQESMSPLKMSEREGETD